MKRKNIKGIIKNYFFINPSVKIRVRQLERKLNLPLPSVIKYCRELAEEGILIRVDIGNVQFYTADRANFTYILEKRLFNLKQLYSSGLINFLKREFSNPNIILFGSYLRGEDIESSDIDLYVETSSKKNLNLSLFENKLKRKIQIFRYKNLKRVKNLNLANNIINGTVLNGFVEVFK